MKKAYLRKQAFTVLELLLVLSILTVLFAIVLFNIRPEDIFEDSDAVKIANDKVDIQTAYTKYKLDNEGDSPFDEDLIPGVVYKICREEIQDCDTSNFEVSLNQLILDRLLKEIPLHPFLSDDRYTGYIISENGGTALNIIDTNELVYNEINVTPGECFTSSSTQYCAALAEDGKLWLDRDLGADSVATSPTDTSAYGDLYQWGRSKDGHQIRTSTVDSSSGRSNSLVPSDDFLSIASAPYNWYSGSNPDNLWQGVTSNNNPCPSSWRLPTNDEWLELINSWDTQNSQGAFDSSLKLVLGGRRNNAGTLQDVGSIGHYWSYTNNGSQDTAKSVRVGTSTATNNNDEERVEALAVRCVKDSDFIVVTPENEQTGNYNTVTDNLGRCTGEIAVNGTYNQGQALGVNHTITFPVFVASRGNYVISTDTINGYSFSASGTFTETGNTTVTLLNNGGTPTSQGTDTFTASASGLNSSCRFDVEVGIPLACSTISVPNTPSGPTSVTNGTGGHVYTVSAVSGASSYEWNYSGSGATITAGANTNSITVSYAGGASSGAWTVRAINSSTPSNCSPTYTTAYSSGLNVTNGAPPTTVVAGTATNTYSASNQLATLNATLTSALGTVNEGTVTFQLKTSGGTNVGTAVTSSTVTAGSASVSYTIPAGTTVGTYNIHATYNPSGNFGLGNDTDATLEMTINKANQAALTISPTSAHTYNTARAYTTGGGSGTGAVSDSLVSGSAIRNSALNYTATSGTGTYVIRLTKAADTNYNAQTNDFTITLAKATQASLTISPTTTHAYNTARAYTTGGGSGTGAVTDSLLSGSATRNSALNYTATSGTGTYVIRLTKAGDTNYNSRTNDFTITLAKVNQAALTISPTTAHTYNTSRTYTGGGGSGTGAVSDSLLSGSATRTGTLTYTANSGTGTYVIRRTKAADANYNAQTNDFTITLAKANQTPLNFGFSFSSQEYNTIYTYSLVSGGNGTGAFSDSLDSGNGVRTGTLSYRATSGTGSYTFRAVKAGDNNYNMVEEYVNRSLNPANQAQVNSTLNSTTCVPRGTTVNFTASGGSGTGLYRLVHEGGVALTLTVSGTTLSIRGNTNGTAQIEFYKSGDSNYYVSNWIDYTINVVDPSQC